MSCLITIKKSFDKRFKKGKTRAYIIIHFTHGFVYFVLTVCGWLRDKRDALNKTIYISVMAPHPTFTFNPAPPNF
jgi:hypothetical protein